MITYKSPYEIEAMKEGGAILKTIFSRVEKEIKPGVSTMDIEKNVQKWMKEYTVKPSFLTVSGYPYAINSPVDAQVVHTMPSDDVILKEGNVVTIDIGVMHKGLHTDSAHTYIVGTPRSGAETLFLEAGEKALKKAISKAVAGNYVYDISAVIQDSIEGSGYCIIPELTGHGVGKVLHEDPYIPGFVRGKREHTARLVDGMTLAIEII